MLEWITANILNLLAVAGSLIAAWAALLNVRLTRKQMRQIQSDKDDSVRPTAFARKGGTISGWTWVTVTIKTKEIGTIVETLEILGEPAAEIVPFPYSHIATFGIARIFDKTDFASATSQYDPMEEIAPNTVKVFCFWYHLEPPARRRFSKFCILRRQLGRSASIQLSLSSMDNHSQRTKMAVAIKAIERKRTDNKSK